jgi:hypothetical protein
MCPAGARAFEAADRRFPWRFGFLVAACCAVLLVPPQAAATSAVGGFAAVEAKDPAWEIVATPNPDRSAGLVDVDAVPRRAWAVGFSLPETGPAFRTVALLRGRDGWRRIATPNPDPLFNRLDGVAVVSRGNAWAAGSRGKGTLIEHWRNERWRVAPSANRRRQQNNLQAIAAAGADDVWAVGLTQRRDGSSASGLIERWDGNTWRIVPSPNPKVYTSLIGVDARSSEDAWAVGTAVGLTGKARNVTLHWDGIAWKAVPTPSPGLFDNTLEDVVALGPDDAWAVGYAADSGVSSRTPLILHWDGVTWAVVPSPPLSGQLNGIVAAREGRLWAVGYREEPAVTLIERWNGSAWAEQVSADRPGSNDDALFGVAFGGGLERTWAVGSAATPDGRLHTLLEQPSVR